MSFSSEVKKELYDKVDAPRHCRLAELAAILSMHGVLTMDQGRYGILLATDHLQAARKYFTLLKKTFNIYVGASVLRHRTEQGKKTVTYAVSVPDPKEAEEVLVATKLLSVDGHYQKDYQIISDLLLRMECCKRAYLRGAFLVEGSITDPNRSYHFEISFESDGKAREVQKILQFFGLDARIAQRKNRQIVYLKEGEAISDTLNLMGATVSMMELENVRIMKDMRNSVNRMVNCETANLTKIVKTAYKQIEDIKLIEERKGLNKLPDHLKEMARVRLDYPESSLVELGKLLDPPVGKSGVNHRLRKLSEIADTLRGED